MNEREYKSIYGPIIRSNKSMFCKCVLVGRRGFSRVMSWFFVLHNYIFKQKKRRNERERETNRKREKSTET